MAINNSIFYQNFWHHTIDNLIVKDDNKREKGARGLFLGKRAAKSRNIDKI